MSCVTCPVCHKRPDDPMAMGCEHVAHAPFRAFERALNHALASGKTEPEARALAVRARRDVEEQANEPL